jgi:pyruvate formate-lyase activating enzyme-like uncharacterized protein
MNNFEDQLDEIRINLYEETKEMDKKEIIKTVNSHAKKIAHEFGIIVSNTRDKTYLQPISV